MSKFIKVFALVMLMVVSAGVYAQSNPINDKNWSTPSDYNSSSKVIKRDVDMTNDSVAILLGKPKDNWFITAGLGLHMFCGNEKMNSARVNPLTPQIGMKVGKWLVPSVALSLNLDLGYAKGQSTNNVYVPSTSGEYSRFTFFYYDLYGEVTLDWMNLVCGYYRASHKKWHLQNTIGMGFAWQTGKAGNPSRKGIVSNYEMSFHFGFNNDFRLNDKLILFVEPKLALMRGTWDYSPMSNTYGRFDLLTSVSVGVKFNLGKKAKHQFDYGTNVKLSEIRQLNNEIGKLAKENTMLQENDKKTIDSLNNVIEDLRSQLPIPLQIIDVIEEKDLEYMTIYYQINSALVDYSSERSLKVMAAKIMKSSPNTKFYIISSADKATGTPAINDALSKGRCNGVYKILVDKYGVNPNKLIIHSLGGIDHYQPDELNRMSIVVENDSDVVRILTGIEQ